ncbi:unnamed protein product [Rotaria sordida]|uniref:protein-serine/threonine phosphatase n=1 Tax=Rotaria sordida TaxID=392033 RepID=A0A814WR68_9BILA|nr:unnamed protein product [Rotaria sordida]
MFEKKSDDKIKKNIFSYYPKTRKDITYNQLFAFAGMQGWRTSNEDFHKHLIPIDDQSWKRIDTAKNAANLVDKYIIDALNQIRLNPNNELIDKSQFNINQFSYIIKNKFLQLDKHLSTLVNDQSGSVCIVCLIGPLYIYLINLGDSRGIIISNNGQVLASTKDHKPSVEQEKKRIEKAGGRVTQCENDVPRVEYKLAISRTLGDYTLDKRFIPASPDIIQYPINSSASFVIIACDGIWDVMTNEQVAQFVSQKASNTSIQDIASQLLDQSFILGSTDNMSIYIIKISN